MVEAKTPPDAKILSLTTVANAYLSRDVRVSWQSAESDNLLDSLRLAAVSRESLFDWRATWPLGLFRRLRFRLSLASNSECDIDDIRIYSGEDLVYTSPNWTLRAWPNSWEAPLALDGNLATRWRTWEPVRAGVYFGEITSAFAAFHRRWGNLPSPPLQNIFRPYFLIFSNFQLPPPPKPP
jgi:hypothetical protein